MNIALVTETFPPEVNGVAMTLDRLVNGMTARGHEMLVIRPDQGPDDQPAIKDGVSHLLLPGRGIPGYPELRFGFPAKRKLAEFWRVDPPDLVHVATEGPLGWSAVSAARELGIPITSSFHTNFHSYGRHYRLPFLKDLAMTYLKVFHNRTRTTFAPTRDIRMKLSLAGVRNLEVLGRGVDSVLFSPHHRSETLRTKWNATKAPVVLHVGRLAPEKNIPLAIRAFEAIRKEYPGARLVLVGSGPLEERLRNDHPEIVFPGLRRGADLAAHYASADLFLFPSLTETYGNVLTEAMASGLPVVAFNYAAAREHIVSGKNGITIPYGDEDEFVKAAETLARTPEHSRQMGATARRTATRIGWETIVEQWEKTLLSITGNHDASPTGPAGITLKRRL